MTLGASLFATSCSDDESSDSVDVVDVVTNNVAIPASAAGVGTTTWTKDNVYVLDGFVFVKTS